MESKQEIDQVLTRTEQLQEKIHKDITLILQKLSDKRSWWRKLLGMPYPADIRYQAAYDTVVLNIIAELQVKLEKLEQWKQTK